MMKNTSFGTIAEMMYSARESMLTKVLESGKYTMEDFQLEYC